MTQGGRSSGERRDRIGRPMPPIRPAPAVVYKYIKPDDAHFLKSGNLLVSSLREFAACEGDRADPLEGREVFSIPNGVYSGTLSPAQHAALRAYSGINIPIGAHFENASIFGFASFSEAPDLHCICFADRPDIDRPDGKAQAVFEVRNFGLILQRLLQLHGFTTYASGFVNYEERGGPIFGPKGAAPDPFRKPLDFSWEREIRACFPALHPEPLGMKAVADPFIASMMRRLPDRPGTVA